MATLTYTFVQRCAGGGHTTLDVSFNGGANNRVVYTTDEVREPLASLTQAEREALRPANSQGPLGWKDAGADCQ
jgi:hypothetical protein